MNPLPLRLTPFEQSLWVDDCPAFPWNILFRLRFAGPLDRGALEQSLQVVAARHPFFTARVRRRWTQRTWWEPLDVDPPAKSCRLHWNEHEFGSWPNVRHLQIEAGEVLEAWVRSGETESEILLNFHHVAADGSAAIRILDELLQAYAAIAAGRRPSLPPSEPQQLKRRGRYGYSLFGLLKIAPKLVRGIVGIVDFLRHKPVPLVPHEAVPREQPPAAGYPLLRSHTFTQAETAALLHLAKQAGATLNDLLMRDLFLTLHAWRKRRGANDDAWLRLLIPIDLRTPSDAALPAADVMSTVFFDRRASDGADPAALLRSIHDQMQRIKRNHLGLIYVLILGFTDLTPGLLAWLARRQKFTCSAILSNLLRVLEKSPLPRNADDELCLGSTTLRSLEFFPPIRPFMCAAYGIATYAGRLTLTVHVDPRFLAPHDADALLGEFVAAVTVSLHRRLGVLDNTSSGSR